MQQAYAMDLGTGFDAPTVDSNKSVLRQPVTDLDFSVITTDEKEEKRRSKRGPVTDIDAPGIGTHYAETDSDDPDYTLDNSAKTGFDSNRAGVDSTGTGFDTFATVFEDFNISTGFDAPPPVVADTSNAGYPILDPPGQYINKITISDDLSEDRFANILGTNVSTSTQNGKQTKISDFHLERELNVDSDDEEGPLYDLDKYLLSAGQDTSTPMVLNFFQSGETTDAGVTLVQDGIFIPEEDPFHPVFIPTEGPFHTVPSNPNMFLPIGIVGGESSTDNTVAPKKPPKKSRKEAPVFKYEDFALNNFQGGITETFEKIMLRQPLLKQKNTGDKLVSLRKMQVFRLKNS